MTIEELHQHRRNALGMTDLTARPLLVELLDAEIARRSQPKPVPKKPPQKHYGATKPVPDGLPVVSPVKAPWEKPIEYNRGVPER